MLLAALAGPALMLLSPIWHAMSRLVIYTSHSLLILSLLISVAYSLGWIHRFLWYLAETECTKLLNHTTVTCGNLRLDLLRGRAWASNVVIHAPRREQWKWESPILARIGSVYVETNLLGCLLSLWFLGEEQPLELYTVHVSDIQCFVERKQHFFNFFLLDPHVELPDPRELMDDDDEEQRAAAAAAMETEHHDDDDRPLVETGSDTAAAASLARDTSWDMHGENNTNNNNLPAEEKAQRLLGDMFRALSRAAKEGQSLQGALVEHRQTITRELKALQSTNKKSAAMQEGVKIVQHVSKAVVEKSKTVPQVVQPVRRTLGENEPIVYCRIGRILMEDTRIFTRDHANWESAAAGTGGMSSDHGGGGSGLNSSHHSHYHKTSTPAAGGSSSSSSSSWNKPIVVQRVAVRASELCPPLSAMDGNNPDLPALYQTIDKCIEVVWKRVLAEGAKSNTGRLFKTAMGEVLGYWMETDNSTTQQQQAPPSSSSSLHQAAAARQPASSLDS